MGYKFLIASVGVLFSANAFCVSSYAQDTGRIGKLYVSASGNMVFQLEGGFPNARTDGQCPTASLDSYAGNINSGPTFKSTILAAKAAKQTLIVTTQGCDVGGGG